MVNTILSASKLKTFKSCSWLYNANYVLKLPKKGNDGMARGNVVHILFECLLDKRHEKYYKMILNKKGIRKIPVIDRFVKSQMRRYGIITEKDSKGNNNFDLIEEMILVGLLTDFYCETANLEKAETEFSFTDKEVQYNVRGFIDKLATQDNKLLIYDYKSSERCFEGEDLVNNVQAKMYSLYAKRIRNMEAVVRFIFLRFPDNPIIELQFTDKELDEFEEYLIEVTKKMDAFTYQEAISDMAARKPYPTDKSFSGPTLCGYAKKKGHTNPKTGKLYWACDYKFGFEYFGLFEQDENFQKKLIKTAFEEAELLKDKKENQWIDKLEYAGCPAWNRTYTELPDDPFDF